MKRRERGGGTVYRDGKWWIAAVSIGSGKSRSTRKKKASTEAAAWERLRELREDRPQLHTDDPAVTVETFLRAWLDDIVRPGVRETTYAMYESVVRTHVYPRIGSYRLDRLKTDHLRAMFRDLEKAKVGGRLREIAYLRLKTAFRFAVGRSIAISPMEGVTRPRPARRSMKVWDQEQARAFLSATALDDLAPLYRLALSIGLRRGELLALQWPDVDLKAGRLSVHHTLTNGGELMEPKTSGSRRPIELPRKALAALQAQRARKRAAIGPWVFPAQHGGPRLARAVSAAFNKAVKSAGVPAIRFHDLRHTCASLRLQNGDHVKVVSEMLGHASIQITLDTYAHTLPSMQRESADRFDAVL